MVSHSDMDVLIYLEWTHFKTEKENHDNIYTAPYHNLIFQSVKGLNDRPNEN